MARNVALFQAQTAADLETAVNTALALLTDPTINFLDIAAFVDARRNGTDLRAALTYTTGGASLATPFLLKMFSGATAADVEAAAQAFMDAQTGYFYGGLRLLYSDVGRREPQYILWMLYNTTGGASANYDLQ
jgi:hypothetical protein